ncbi:single-stranded DNA-binding protein [Candidatus Poribacteria bacterium]|jgi:single-strand DNA-binding protein|nr:single-stranded DNA-binding protein [Candidatus Poribacteria bacterium]MBT5534529.1 single-stranded DNA-binding protein [Candidatus Poribacteria bacterium]MBT5713498.1 single-stranded DNA-binding protein [Candidatus Poribacteria bacterium]MBT7808281.1 single-stranded DNA-binding protein [Candidatus Poribacteria bacterium]
MAAEMNKVILIGNLTRDPEMRYLDSGTAVAKLGLAVNRRYTDRNGDRKEETCFVDIDAWARLAEICNQYLKRGSRVLVEGNLMFRQWETDSGDKRSAHSVRAQTVQFLDRPDGDGGGQGSGDSYSRPAAQPSQSQSQGSAPADDDIPF